MAAASVTAAIRKGTVMRNRFCVLAAASLLWTVGGALGDENTLTPEDLRALDRPSRDMMKDYLTALVDEQFARREAVLAGLQTAEDWSRHAQHIRKSMAAWTGDLPERTPLKARVTGRIEREGHVTEKILFESRPGRPPKRCRDGVLHRLGRALSLLR